MFGMIKEASPPKRPQHSINKKRLPSKNSLVYFSNVQQRQKEPAA
jgi:hypothetical protein